MRIKKMLHSKRITVGENIFDIYFMLKEEKICKNRFNE